MFFWLTLVGLIMLFFFLADPVRFMRRLFFWSLILMSFLTPFWPFVLLGGLLLYKMERFFK